MLVAVRSVTTGVPGALGSAANVEEVDLFNATYPAGFNLWWRSFQREAERSYFTSFTCELTREMKAPRRAAESAAFINLTFPGVYHVNN